MVGTANWPIAKQSVPSPDKTSTTIARDRSRRRSITLRRKQEKAANEGTLVPADGITLRRKQDTPAKAAKLKAKENGRGNTKAPAEEVPETPTPPIDEAKTNREG